MKIEYPNSESFKKLTTAGLVVNWIFTSAALILFNKWLLTDGGFPFPVTLTLIHQVFCTFVAFVVVNCNIVPQLHMPLEDYIKGVVPVGAFYSIALWLGNWAYLHLQVSFVQMLKAFMPAIVFSIGLIIGNETFNLRLFGILLIICFGILIASYGEAKFSLFGVMLQLGSMTFEASRLSLLQMLLQRKGYKLNPITTMYYLSPITAFFLAILCYFTELSTVADKIAETNLLVLLANCTIALMLNIAVFLIVGKTSALTMNVSGVIKDWIIITFSVVVFNSILTVLNVIGFTIAFLGVGGYNYVRRQMNAEKEMQAKKLTSKGIVTGETKSSTEPLVNSNANKV